MQSLRRIAYSGGFHSYSALYKLSTLYYCQNSSFWVLSRHWFLCPVLKRNLKSNFSNQAFCEDLTLTVSQKINLLSMMNHSPVSTLQEYGLSFSTAAAVHKSRPFSHFNELESFPGIGKEKLLKIYRKYSQTSQLSLQQVQPPLSIPEPPENMVSVTITQGCICYCYLSLSDLMKSPSDDTPPAVEMLDIDRLPIETSDSRLHPHKLLTKVENALRMVPSAAIYVMPNARYGSYTRKTSAEETSVKKQLAQITGMVQGHLAMAPSPNSPSLYYLRDSYMLNLFHLKVVGDTVTSNLSLVQSLLRGESVPTDESGEVPRLKVSREVYARCRDRNEIFLHAVAPALYTSLAFCVLLRNAFSTPL